MITFFASEVAFFGTLIMAYVIYMGQNAVDCCAANGLADSAVCTPLR